MLVIILNFQKLFFIMKLLPLGVKHQKYISLQVFHRDFGNGGSVLAKNCRASLGFSIKLLP